jgi:hypothetical protein
MRHAVGSKPCRGEGARRRRDVEGNGTHAAGEIVELRVLPRQRRQRRIDLDQRHRRAGDAGGERKARTADARAEIDDAIAGARWTGCCQQDRVVAHTMAALGLPQAQTAAKHRVVGHIIRRARWHRA